MTDTRLALALAGMLALGTDLWAADGKNPPRRGGLESGRVRFLAELLRTDPDEKKQRAAVAELADADPRVHPEVIPTLLKALKKEAAGVREAAAEVLGRFKATFPLAGAALESAAESDPSPAVRDAARQALWQYHLNGYQSARSATGFPPQTAEPPLASPARQRPVVAEPPAVPVVRTAASAPDVPPRPPADSLPPINPPDLRVGPRVALLPGFFGPRTILAGTSRPEATDEPPIARRPDDWFPPPTPDEPPPPPTRLHPASAGKPPAFVRDLPPVVSDPGFLPGVGPFPNPTPEPPRNEAGRR